MKKTILISVMLLFVAALGFNLANASTDQPHVYINPGHGGHSSDDRNVPIYPYAQGDTMGFWESNSNMYKCFALREILWKKGYKVTVSRETNTEDDDLALSTIVRLCNNSGADVFYSIHSNATGLLPWLHRPARESTVQGAHRKIGSIHHRQRMYSVEQP